MMGERRGDTGLRKDWTLGGERDRRRSDAVAGEIVTAEIGWWFCGRGERTLVLNNRERLVLQGFGNLKKLVGSSLVMWLY